MRWDDYTTLLKVDGIPAIILCMTGSDKQILYAFLNAAEDSLDGHRKARPAAEFRDDPAPGSPSCPETGRFASLGEVERAVMGCSACPLAAARTLTVPGEGPQDSRNARVLVVGEGPGADEDASGRPFVGKAGQLLDRMLGAIGLSRQENCYITNVVKCRPPDNREPQPEEASACRPFLEAQIGLLRPTLILALGRTASQSLLSTSEGITSLRGTWREYRGIPVLPTYHPSALLRNEGLKRPAWEDLKEFRARLDSLAGV